MRERELPKTSQISPFRFEEAIEKATKGGWVDFSMPYGVLWTGLNAEIAQKYICDSSELCEGVRLFLSTPSEVRSACISVRVRSAWRFLKKKRNKLSMQRKPLKRDSAAMPLFAFMA